MIVLTLIALSVTSNQYRDNRTPLARARIIAVSASPTLVSLSFYKTYSEHTSPLCHGHSYYIVKSTKLAYTALILL